LRYNTHNMRMLTAVRAAVAKYWLPCALYGGSVLAFGWLLWWRLGALTGKFNGAESLAMTHSQNLHSIWNFPVDAPFLLLGHAFLHFYPNNPLAMRLSATIFGITTLAIFYGLVRFWHGQRAAIFGTFVFGASAWFLHSARFGSPDILLFSLLGLTAAGVWLKHSKRSLAVGVCLLLAAVLLYVPGMVWFIGAGVIWQWKAIDRAFKQHLWMVTLGGFLVLAAIAPLGLAIYHTPQYARLLVGLPPAGWPQPLDTLRAIAEVPLNFIARGPDWPEHWLGHLAILDAFSLAMLFLGVYVYAKHAKLVRTQLLAVILIIGTVLVGLQGPVTITVLVPFVYIMVAAGIGLVVDRWYAVFPRNPIAQAMGVGLVSLAVFTTCWYGYRHYFVAWPNAPETRAAYVIPAPPPSDTIKR
jgi:hypothetical protein